MEGAWSSPGKRELFENIERDGYTTYAISNYTAGDVRIGVAQLYQFERNQRVHPYARVGVDIVRRHASVERPEHTRTIFLRNGNIAVVVPAASMQKTTFFARMTVEFRTRIPEPAAKAAAVGSAIAAGTFLGLLAVFATTLD